MSTTVTTESSMHDDDAVNMEQSGVTVSDYSTVCEDATALPPTNQTNFDDDMKMKAVNDGGVNNDDIIDYDVTIVEQMLQACESNDMKVIHHIIDTYGTMYGCYAIPSTGRTPLMIAALTGNMELVEYLLLECHAPWNAIDRTHHYCAGDYATHAEHWEIVNLLVDWATRAELILGAIERQQRYNNDTIETSIHCDTSPKIELDGISTSDSSTKPDYLRQRLQYTEDGNALIDADKDAVMMEWERPIMKAHAQLMMESTDATKEIRRKRVLNVGFGMGIIDTILQEQYTPVLHIIIEAHPDVYRYMIRNGWDQKPNVRICYGTWQTVLPQLKSEGCVVDAIFFDTYGEHYLDMVDFHEQMVHLLAKPHGIYSFFNGLAPDNLFFHGVACQCVKIQLSALGIDSEFVPCEIQVPNETVWKDVRRKYWYGRDTYYLPVCTWNQEYITTNINPHADILLKMTTNQKRKYESFNTSTIAETGPMDMDDTSIAPTNDGINDQDVDDVAASKRIR